MAGCRVSNISGACVYLHHGVLSANAPASPHLLPWPFLSYQLSGPSHSSRSPREGSHWPALSHVSSLNQSLWPGMPFSHWPDLSHMSTPRSQEMEGREHMGWDCTGTPQREIQVGARPADPAHVLLVLAPLNSL